MIGSPAVITAWRQAHQQGQLSSLRRNPSEITWPPVRMAKSSSRFFWPSPFQPGALTAMAVNVPRILFTIERRKGVAVEISQMIRSYFLPERSTWSRIGTMSAPALMRLSVMNIQRLSSVAVKAPSWWSARYGKRSRSKAHALHVTRSRW